MKVGSKKWSLPKSTKKKKLQKEAEEWAKNVTSSVKIVEEPLSPLGKSLTVDSYPSSSSADDGTVEGETDIYKKQSSKVKSRIGQLPPRSPHPIQSQVCNEPTIYPAAANYSGSSCNYVSVESNHQKKIVKFVDSRDSDEGDGVEVYEIQNPSQTTKDMHACNYSRHPESYYGGSRSVDDQDKRITNYCPSMMRETPHRTLSHLITSEHKGSLNNFEGSESDREHFSDALKSPTGKGLFSPRKGGNNVNSKIKHKVTPRNRVITSIRTQLGNCFQPKNQVSPPASPSFFPPSQQEPKLEMECRRFSNETNVATEGPNGVRHIMSNDHSDERRYWHIKQINDLHLSQSENNGSRGGVISNNNHFHQLHSKGPVIANNPLWTREGNIRVEFSRNCHPITRSLSRNSSIK